MAKSLFRYFKTSPEIIQLAVMMYVRFPLSLRNIEDLLHKRGIDVCHESVRLWVDRFGPMFAGKTRLHLDPRLTVWATSRSTAISTVDRPSKLSVMQPFSTGVSF